MNKYRRSSVSSEKTIFFMIGGMTVLALMMIGFVAINESKSQAKITSYDAATASRPKATVTTTFSDFGKMKVTDEKTAKFVIENSAQFSHKSTCVLKRDGISQSVCDNLWFH